MCQFTELLPQTKSEKCGALVWEAATDNDTSQLAGVLTITGKKCHCRYAVEEFVSDHGRGFVLKKIDTGSDRDEGYYSCLIGPHGTKLCECKGFTSTGGCKHTAALTALIEAGQL